MNLYQDLFFRALDAARGRHSIERLRFLRASQYWEPEQLRAWQLARLNELLLRAGDQSAYYAETLAGVRLPLPSLDAVSSLPILKKTAIRTRFEDITCRDVPPRRRVLSRTGGSTGEPTFYYLDKRGTDWNRGTVYRSAEWAGVALGERTVQMSGSHFDYTRSRRLFNRVAASLHRSRDYPVAVITPELLERYFRGVQAWRPTSIWGYASGLATFAAHVAAQHPEARFDFLRAVITSSETLRPEQRAAIDAAFGHGKTHDHYGAREMYLGAECSAHAGYHLHAEVLLVEVVDPGNSPCPPGARGRILVTDLSNHAFPFVRYEIGDVGSMAEEGPCPCGRRLPRLASVEGRIADLIVLRDRILTAPNFATLFSDMPGIKAYQIRQDSLDRLEVLIVPDQGYREGYEQYVQGAIEKMVAGKASVIIRKVPEIAVPESGKRRFIVSTVGGQRL